MTPATLPPTLFTPIQVGALALDSRIVMAPLTRNRAPGALPNALMAAYYAQRANPATGAALIITEATAISHQAQGYADVPGIWSDAQVAAWRPIADAVHAAGGKIVMQLWHVGRVSHVDLQPGGAAPVAPSALAAKTKTVLLRDGQPVFVDTAVPRALAADEIPGIVADYRRAARNAIAAGMDGVEVHAANGYLIDQFLRSGSNQRTDAYGGSIENRTRFLREVLHAVADEIGGARTGIRLSPVTPANDAVEAEPQPLFNHVAQHVGSVRGQGQSLAYVHVIEGATGGPRDHQQGTRAFDYAALRAAWRAAGGTGAWMVNNGYDRPLADAALAGQGLSHGADLVAFGRPFIANPDLAARLKTGSALNALDKMTLYGGGAKGYTDYPTLSDR